MEIVGKTIGRYKLLEPLNQRQIAIVGDDRITRIWELPSGEFIASAPSSGDEGEDIEYSPDGRLLAISAGDSAVLWDTVKRRRSAVLHRHESTVGRVYFSPDGQALATLSHDTTARLWAPSGTAAFEARTSSGSETRAIVYFRGV